MTSENTVKCERCGNLDVPRGCRTCPKCGAAISETSKSSGAISVELRIGTVQGGQVTGLEIGPVGGDVTVGAVNTQIETFVQRALTAAEEAERVREVETRLLARGVSDFARSLQAQVHPSRPFGPSAGNPYKGLLAYSLSDADLFFGRTDDIRQFFDHLRQGRLTILHAESGAGKTSLLGAGIAPSLIVAGHLPVPLRPYDQDPGLAIKQAFISNLADAPSLAGASLRDFLRRVGAILGLETAVVIFLDQFEEFFTLQKEADRPAFDRVLAECLEDRGLNVCWVLALRTESFGRLATFGRRIDPFKNEYYLPRLGLEQARAAVIGPATSRDVTFEPGLVDELLQALSDHDQIAPPPLQLVCSALYEGLEAEGGVITRALYEDQGGVAGILNNYLDRVLQSRFSGELRRQAYAVLTALITSEGQRTLCTRDELAGDLAPQGMKAEALDAILPELVESRLVGLRELGGDYPGPAYELVHDYLAERLQMDPATRARKAAKELLDDAVEAYRKFEDKALLGADQLAIIETQRPHLNVSKEAEELLDKSQRKLVRQQRRARRRTVLGLIAASAAALAAVLAVFFFIASGREKDLRAEVERQAAIARAQQLAIQSQAAPESIPQQALLLAVESMTATHAYTVPEPVAAQQALRDALNKPVYSPLMGHNDSITSISFSPNDQWLATASLDGTLRLWDFRSGKPGQHPTVLSDHQAAIWSAAFSQDGRWLASGGVDQAVRLWRIEGSDISESAALKGHTLVVSCLAFSPDSRWLASGSYDNTVRLWDLDSLDTEAVVLQGHTDAVLSVAFSHDGQLLASASKDKTIRLWDMKQPPGQESLVLEPVAEPTKKLAFSADDQWLVSVSPENSGQLWRLVPQGQASIPLGTHAVLNPDGAQLATNRDFDILIGDLHSSNPLQTPIELPGQDGEIRSIAFSPNGKILASAGADNMIHLWSLTQTSSALRPIPTPPLADDMLVFSPDGRWLAAVGLDNITYVWSMVEDLLASEPVRLESDPSNPINSVALSSDGRWLAAAGANGKIDLWSLQSGLPSAEVSVLDGHGGPVKALSFSPDGQWLASIGADATMRLWMTGNTGFASKPIVLGASSAASLDFSHDSRWLAAAAPCRLEESLRRDEPPPDKKPLPTDCRVFVWDLQGDDPLASQVELTGHRALVNAIRFSSDGHFLASASLDNTIRLWDCRNDFKFTASLGGLTGGVSAIAFSPDGRWLVAGRSDAGFQVWNVVDPKSAPSAQRSNAVNSIVFSSDGQWLATASSDFTARVWAFGANGIEGRSWILRGHQGPISDLAFSSDSKWLATGSSDATFRLWDMRSNEPSVESIVLRDHKGPVSDLAFSEDNRWLATAGSDGCVRLWHMRIDELLGLACRAAGRNLTYNEWVQFFPGQDYRRTCLDYPAHATVAESFLAEGRILASNGDIPGAVRQFQKALEADPDLDLHPEAEAQAIASQPMTNKLGFYLEAFWPPQVPEAISRVQPPVILVFGGIASDITLLQEIRHRAPNAFVIGRMFIPLDAQWQMSNSDDPEGQGRALADEILYANSGLATVRDENGRLLIDAWMSLNNPVPGPASQWFTENPEEAARVYHNYDRFQVAFRRRLQEAGVEAVAFNFWAGEFTKSADYIDYFPGTLAEYKYLGFQEYGWPTLFPGSDSATNALAYRNIMADIRSRYGDQHRVIVTELGLARAYRHPGADVGWLYPDDTISESSYWDSLEWYNSAIAQDDYVLGACLFAVGTGPEWETFRHLGTDNEGRPLTIIDRIAALQKP